MSGPDKWDGADDQLSVEIAPESLLYSQTFDCDAERQLYQKAPR